MSYDVIAGLCEWLADEVGVPVSVRPPSDLPDEFLTIERTGGATGFAYDEPNLVVQAWAASELDAYQLALQVRDLVTHHATDLGPICSGRVGSIYQFPDPEERRARVQLDVYLVTRL